MNSKEYILNKIRQNTKETFPMPDLEEMREAAIKYENIIQQFCDIMTMVGGKGVVLEKGQDLNQLIMSLYPDCKRIASTMPEITCATFNPDDVETPAELNGTDLAIIKGEIGVAENGAVWIEQKMKHRAVYFITENLVILLPKDKLVNNMHEAYKLVSTGEKGYGCFISGPSKTADIEQALVMGAHGARGVTVILI